MRTEHDIQAKILDIGVGDVRLDRVSSGIAWQGVWRKTRADGDVLTRPTFFDRVGINTASLAERFGRRFYGISGSA